MNVERNPYSAPQSVVSDPYDGTDELASRGVRLAGVIIDTIIILCVTIPVMWFSGYFARAMAGIQPSIAEQVGWSVFGFVTYVALHGWLLYSSGQTIAKRMLGIRIVDMQSRDKPVFGKLVALRYFVPQLIYSVPIAGPLIALVGALLIFRSDRRPLHDLIAGTQVVVAR